MTRSTPRLAAVLAMLAAAPAAGHPVDEVVQTAYITLTPSRVEFELDLTPGAEVAGVLIGALDADGDDIVSDPEARAFGETVLERSTLKLDGRPARWVLYQVTAPPLRDLRSGNGIIRIQALADQLDAPGARRLEYHNAYAPAGSQWTANIFLNPGEGRRYDVADQARADDGRSLTVAYTVR